jgi:hypothetical protein
MDNLVELLKELLEHMELQRTRIERVLAWINGTPVKSEKDLVTVLQVAKAILKGEAIAPDAYRINKDV